MTTEKVAPTKKMAQFIEENKINKVVSGERLGDDGRPALTRKALSEPGFLRYVLENKKTYVLSAEDTASAPDFTPGWFGMEKK